MNYKYRIVEHRAEKNKDHRWPDGRKTEVNNKNDNGVSGENSNMAVVITEYLGHDSLLRIPDTIDDMTVISVDKKAFMGCKNLTEVSVPVGIKEIGDYAFAQCSHLKKVVFEDEINYGTPETVKHSAGNNRSGIKIGRKTFEGCSKIENIYFKSLSMEEDISFLAAAVVNRLPALSLLSDDDIGSPFWIERFDLALKNFMARDDMEGYDDTALCGEEDISYDGIGSVDGELPGESESFVREACKNKCYLCLLRLRYNSGLADSFREYLENYIREHSRSHSNEAAWRLVKEDLKNDPEYISLYLDVIQPDMIVVEKMLEDTDGGQALLKSMLISHDKKRREQDLFEGLLL